MGDESSRKSRPLALSVSVPTEDLGYPVLVGPGLRFRLGAELRRSHGKAKRVALISDENVMPLYGDDAEQSLRDVDLEVHRLVIPPGEASKTPERLVELTRRLVELGMSRKDVVVALGGGVVGDLAGLVAATFMRGIPFIQCPTSLLAQVDASVGGKVAVDLPEGKNLFGAFHFPSVVVVDPEVLETLSDRQLACGTAEMLKHGALFSPEHFEELVASAGAIFDRDPDITSRLVAKSVAHKANCVGRDPRETGGSGGGRALLNLGHTFGHAIEHLSEFDVLHGEAVAMGLIAAARVSERLQISPAGLEATFREAVTALRLPTELDTWVQGSTEQLVQALSRDKKRDADAITFIALRGVGQPTTVSLEPAEIVSLLRDQNPAR